MNEALRRAALSLGGNLGDPTASFAYALQQLREGSATRVSAVSSVYRTAPWGRTDQPDFLNLAALIETDLQPEALLAMCLAIEAARGRSRGRRWAPRTLDIDIIDIEGKPWTSPSLNLPHPFAHERSFVLIPLLEIAPDLRIGGETVRILARRLGAGGVSRDEIETRRLLAALAWDGGADELD